MSHVSFLKGFLLLLIAALVLVLFLWPSEQEDRLRITPLEDTKEADIKSVSASTLMVAPRFTGEDSKSRKWEIKASSAAQSVSNSALKVSLKGVEANAQTGENGLSFKAGEGSFDQKEKRIELKENVVVKGAGFVLEADQISGDLESKDVSGTSDVRLRSKEGELKAAKFEIIEGGSKIRLSGGVHGRFYPGASPSFIAPETEAKQGE